jgi:hypothetical protein
MFKIEFYVPEQNYEPVTQALFSAGAGKIGAYDQCAWRTAGIGQFRPLDGSVPYIGESGRLECFSEVKVEVVCSEEFLSKACAALISAHPYEVPAYFVTEMLDTKDFGLGK